MGVACPLAGSFAFQSARPDSTSKARRNGSIVPAMKTSPPPVTIGPPIEIEPAGTSLTVGANDAIDPNGTCHFIDRRLKSIAMRLPHGGRLHGNPDGACK